MLIKSPSIRAIAATLGISDKAIHNRLKRGWTRERAMTTPRQSSASQAGKHCTPEHRQHSDALLNRVFPIMGKRGLSNKKLAAEIGISHGSIANWLSRESPISPAWVEAVQTWLEKQAC